MNLVEKVFDNDGIIGLGKFEPFVKARRRVTAAAFAVGLGGIFDGFRLSVEELGELVLGVKDETINRVRFIVSV